MESREPGFAHGRFLDAMILVRQIICLRYPASDSKNDQAAQLAEPSGFFRGQFADGGLLVGINSRSLFSSPRKCGSKPAAFMRPSDSRAPTRRMLTGSPGRSWLSRCEADQVRPHRRSVSGRHRSSHGKHSSTASGQVMLGRLVDFLRKPTINSVAECPCSSSHARKSAAVSKNVGILASRPLVSCSRQKEERHRDDRINHQQHRPFEPVRLAVLRDHLRRADSQDHRGDLHRREQESIGEAAGSSRTSRRVRRTSAICKAEPIAIPTARSAWFFQAMMIAVECSAALPTIATTITPTKISVSPSAWLAWLDRPDQDLTHPGDEPVDTTTPRPTASVPTRARECGMPCRDSSCLGCRGRYGLPG